MTMKSRKRNLRREVAVALADDRSPARGPIWRTRAPFRVGGRWRQVTWNHHHGNSHVAILEKARELNADAWDFGQADHGLLGSVNF